MRNNLYWQNRLLEMEELVQQEAEAQAAALEAEYRRAQAEIDREIRAWYQRFADNNEISLADAKRLLSSREMEELRWDVQDYIAIGQKAGADPLWIKQLENASARYHVTRLDALKLRTQQHAEVLFGNQLDAADRHMRHVVTDGYYRTLFEYQKGFGIGWDVGQLDTRRLDLIMAKPWAADGHVFSERIWADRTRLVNNLHSELIHSTMLGKAPDGSIKAIAKQMGTSLYNAGRLYMTESAAMYAISQGDAYNELDVEEYELVATLDRDTSALCRALDGKTYRMADYKPGDTAPPFHPWCRTVTVPHYKDMDGMRAARGADGKTYYVPSDMKYEDWLATQTAAQSGPPVPLPAPAPGATMAVEDCTDIVQLNQFVAAQLKGRGVTKVDYTGMDLELAKGNAKHLLQLHGEYNSQMVTVQVGDLGKCTYARVVRFGIDPSAVLEYNPRFFKDRERLEKLYTQDTAINFHPKGTEVFADIAITTHEFAHTLTSCVQSEMLGQHTDFWKGVKSIKRRYVTEMNRLGRASPSTAEEAKEMIGRLEKIYISNYAGKNNDEFMAEAFAMAKLSDEPSPYAVEVMELVEEYFGR